MKCQHNPYLESIKTSIIGTEKIREIRKSIIGIFWSIIDSSLLRICKYNHSVIGSLLQLKVDMVVL